MLPGSAVKRGQEPAGAALGDGVHGIAGTGTKRRDEQGMRVLDKHVMEDTVAANFLFHMPGVDGIGNAAERGHGLARHGRLTEGGGDPGSAFAADGCGLNGVTVFHDGEHAEYGGFREVDIGNTLSGMVENLLRLKGDEPEQGSPATDTFGAELSQELISSLPALRFPIPNAVCHVMSGYSISFDA